MTRGKKEKEIFGKQGLKLTYFEVEYVVRTDCFAAVLYEFINVDGDGQSLQFHGHRSLAMVNVQVLLLLIQRLLALLFLLRLL